MQMCHCSYLLYYVQYTITPCRVVGATQRRRVAFYLLLVCILYVRTLLSATRENTHEATATVRPFRAGQRWATVGLRECVRARICMLCSFMRSELIKMHSAIVPLDATTATTATTMTAILLCKHSNTASSTRLFIKLMSCAILQRRVRVHVSYTNTQRSSAATVHSLPQPPPRLSRAMCTKRVVFVFVRVFAAAVAFKARLPRVRQRGEVR